MKNLSRRSLFQYGIIAFLLLFTPVTIIIRKLRTRYNRYAWKDTPGKSISLPEETRGQIGFCCSVSPDKKTIGIAGNVAMPQEVIEHKVDEILLLWGLRPYLFLSANHNENNYDFTLIGKQIYNPTVIHGLAISSTNQIAYIAGELPLKLPATLNDLHKIASNKQSKEFLSLKKEVEKLQKAGNYPNKLYLLDYKTGFTKVICTINESVKISRFYRSRGSRTLTWNHEGSEIIFFDSKAIRSIDLQGNKKDLYIFEDSGLFSNIYCDVQNNLTFLRTGKKSMDGPSQMYNGEPELITIDQSGKVLSTVPFPMYPGTFMFDESIFARIEENHILCVEMMGEKNTHKAVLKIYPRMVNYDNYDWKDKTLVYEIYDPSRVQFYYQPVAFMEETKEALIIKRRAMRGELATPITLDNVDAPWVELRKIKLG
jgi:hypothetical protein